MAACTPRRNKVKANKVEEKGMNGRKSPNVGLGSKSSGARFAPEARKLVEANKKLFSKYQVSTILLSASLLSNKHD